MKVVEMDSVAIMITAFLMCDVKEGEGTTDRQAGG